MAGGRALLVAAVCCALGGGLACDEPAPSKPAAAQDAESTARAKELRSRAESWWAQRRKLVATCFQCNGGGRVFYRRSWHTCPKCDGRKVLVPAEIYRALWYESRSPTFRAQDGIRERLEAEYKQALNQRPAELFKFKIDRHEVVDATHGAVYVAENNDVTPRPQRWVWSEAQQGKGSWWLWDERADGPWPGAGVAGDAGPDVAGVPLDPQENLSVGELLKGVTSLQHKAVGASKRDAALLLTFDSGPQPGGTDLRLVAVGDWRLVGRAIWAGPSVWTELRFTMRASHRDKFGAVEPRAYLVGAITREQFQRIRWENLSPEEQLALFSPRVQEHEGWTLWVQR